MVYALPPRAIINAFAVHVFTASGAALALLALIAAVDGRFSMMFLCLGAALVVDGIDGAMARRLRVVELLPRWSGDVLDLVVDFLTYVFVPAYAIVAGGLLPDLLAIPAAIVIVITGALYFADREMKTETISSAAFRRSGTWWRSTCSCCGRRPGSRSSLWSSSRC